MAGVPGQPFRLARIPAGGAAPGLGAVALPRPVVLAKEEAFSAVAAAPDKGSAPVVHDPHPFLFLLLHKSLQHRWLMSAKKAVIYHRGGNGGKNELECGGGGSVGEWGMAWRRE